MSSSADALQIVQSLAKRTRTARIPYSALVTYAEKYLAKAADEDPDLEDFAALIECLAGPETTPHPPALHCGLACLRAFDSEADNDVDLADFAVFQEVFTG